MFRSELIQVQESQTYLIHIHGKNYKNAKINTKFRIYIYQKSPNRDVNGYKLVQQRQSKVYENQSSPAYNQSFYIQYFFQKYQFLVVKIFLSDQQYFGSINQVSLSQLIKQYYPSKQRKIFNPQNQNQVVGNLIIWCQKIKPRQKYQMFNGIIQAQYNNQKKKMANLMCCLFSPNVNNEQIYFKICRLKNQANITHQIQVYRSEFAFISQSKDKSKSSNQVYQKIANWQQFNISLSKLCLNNQNTQLLISLCRKNNNLDYVIGSVKIALAKIVQNKAFILYKKERKEIGKIIFKKAQRSHEKNFYQHLQNGLKMSTALFIDFSDSNLQYQKSQSNHNITGELNIYQKVMKFFLRPICEHSWNKAVAVFGFGAIVNSKNYNSYNRVSNRFPINLNQKCPYLQSPAQILKQYEKCIPHLTFSSPTMYKNILSWTQRQCREIVNNIQEKRYLIIYIITDGSPNDSSKQIIEKLIQLSFYPVSIVIIGIGGINNHADKFKTLYDLCNMNSILYQNQYPKIVRQFMQFVEIQKCENNKLIFVRSIQNKIYQQIQQYFNLKR